MILDLEDAVATAEKPATRATIAATLTRPRTGLLYVRVNAADTEFCYGDLVAVVQPGLDGIILPKVESPATLTTIDWVLSQIERERGLKERAIDLIPIIETARGLRDIDAILASGTRVKRVAFGAGDFTLDVNMIWNRNEAELSHARATIVTASRRRNRGAARYGMGRSARRGGPRSLGANGIGLRLPGQDVHPPEPDHGGQPRLHPERG